ncbi:MAG: LysE family translocator [Alphaproteobacteria bacterium]|nr:LysE family translocator [Alphaproteobacteria bacterium]
MSLAVYLSFILTCMIIESTPGPNMAYLAVLSASNGRRAGFAATLGIALGLLIIGIAAALGVATLISNSNIAYQALRWGGIAYLLWLAWDGWKEEPENSPVKTNTPQAHANRKYFRRGLIVNLLNPKAAVFYVAILPGFIAASSGATVQAVTLTVTYVMVATAIHSVIVTLAGTAQKFLEDQKRRLIARRVLSLALVIIAIWFGISTGREEL